MQGLQPEQVTEYARAMLQVFRGNPKTFAVDKNKTGRFKPVELDPERLQRGIEAHIRDEVCLGFYLLDGDMCNVLAFDFDDHGRNDGAIMDARTVFCFLQDNGYQPMLEISQSGEGAHVWLVMPHPMDASTVRLFAKGVLHQCEVKGETYPKQSATDGLEKGLGNLIRFPLFNHSHFETRDGEVIDPITAMSVEPISAYDLRTKGELWYDQEYVAARKTRFETEGLPASVKDLLDSEELFARRWACDVGGLGDPSRSSLVVSLALEMIRRYVPTPEILAALRFWCTKERYEKDDRWLELSLAKAYGFMKARKATVDTRTGGSLAAAVHRQFDRKINGLDIAYPSSIPGIDKAIGGAFFGELVVVGCRTSNGKSAIGLQWLHSMAMQGYAGSLISLEMGEGEVANRMLSHLNLNAPEVSEQEAHDAIDRFYRRAAPIHLATCVYRLTDLLQLVRYQNSAGYRVFVVDHMGKVDSQSESEYSSYSAAYKELSKLAKELNILIICCQQRNRKADEDGEDPNPKLNSLHGGGAIEQDADIVVIGRHLHKENPIPENADRYMIHLLKARNHEIKHPVVECRYNTHTQTFSGL